MPELPEVETVKLGLASTIGQTITKAVCRQPSMRLPVPANLAQLVEGATILGLRRRAKYLLIDLSNGQTMVAHLGMSGSFTLCPASKEIAKHDHVILTLSGGEQLRLNDPRRFGLFIVEPTSTVMSHKLLATQGPEPLEGDFSADYLYTQLQRRSTPIKQVIMDNKVVVGVGNIYASECLFEVGVRPTRAANKVTKTEAAALYQSIVATLKRAIKAGGSSLRDHRQADGTMGYFQQTLKVYGRDGEPCPTCKTILEKVVLGGRASTFCPNCQT